MTSCLAIIDFATIDNCLTVKENDRFSLVSYSSGVTVDIPLTYMTKEKKESAKVAVKGLRATGSTALCDGLVNGTCAHHNTTLLSICCAVCPLK